MHLNTMYILYHVFPLYINMLYSVHVSLTSALPATVVNVSSTINVKNQFQEGSTNECELYILDHFKNKKGYFVRNGGMVSQYLAL